MRIRTKIAVIYAFVTFLILLVAFVLVYVLMIRNTEKVFFDLLWKRAMITAQYNFERDEMTESAWQGVAASYADRLTNESSVIISVADGYNIDTLANIVPNEDYLRSLSEGKTIEYKEDSRQFVGVYYPDNEGNFIVIVSAYDKQGTESARNLFRLLCLILVSSTFLMYVIGVIYAKHILQPIVKIIDNVRTITANNLKTSLIEERGNDELSELSRTFNDMILRLRDAFDMQNSFIRNASHELRNPLTAIMGETEIALSRKRSAGEYEETLKTVLVESERLNVMMQGLLTLAQTGFDFSRVKKEKVDIAAVAGNVLRGFRGLDAKVDVPEGSDLRIMGVESLLEIALINVIGNAVKFSQGKQVGIKIGESGGKIFVEVADRGIGIPHNELKRIFQPFYRAANTSSYKGTGIGLALTYKIIDLHGGKMTITSEIGSGTVVTASFKKPRG